MGVYASQAKLKQASKDLALRWSRTREYWRDENARQFEKKYLDRLHAGLNTCEQALQRMDTILGQVRRDCK